MGILRGLLVEDVRFGKNAHRAVARFVLVADSGVVEPDRVAGFQRRTRGLLVIEDVYDLGLFLVAV